MLKVHTIISGGQSGADLGGNQFALERGLTTYCNVCEHFQPYFAVDRPFYFTLKRNVVTAFWGVEGLLWRTAYNVRVSDATLIFITQPLHKTKGSKRTVEFCTDYQKPFDVIRLDFTTNSQVQAICRLLRNHKPRTLNIAGERICDRAQVVDWLHQAWNVEET